MKFNLLDNFKKKHLILFYFFLVSILSTQSQITENNALQAYNEFGVSTREIVYIHINKSVFVKNEMLGFNAYIIDKAKKTSLPITHNLYCTITNENDEIIKSKLIRVESSFSNNTFKIDSLFTTGTYKFKAYTNWMLNFQERNYYEHSFYVINPDLKEEIKTLPKDKKYTIQVLPEGGHLVSDIKNNLGIIVKDKDGFGLKNRIGKIVSDKNVTVTEFTLNKFGISKAPFTPLPNENYYIIINNNGEEIRTKIKNIENTGIVFSISNLRNKLGLTFAINTATKEIVKNKEYFLAIHNGHELKTTPFKFDGKTEISKIIDYKELYAGVNIFTVFDNEKNRPILERLYFNPIGVSQTNLKNIETIIENDSVTVKLQLNEIIDFNKIQNISISALPNKTKSYNFNSNILSQTYLEPYVRGFIENASYYFSNSNAKTKYDLDNLLITQGWSSYDWGDIFKKPDYSNKFEEGINVVANINGKMKEGFLVYPLKNNKTKIFTPTQEDKAFIQTNLFPEEDELYRVSLLKKRNITEKPNLYVQFYPAKIPNFTIQSYDIPFRNGLLPQQANNFQIAFKNSNDAEMLDGIVIQSNVNATRMEKIKNRSSGNVDFFNDTNSRGGQTLALYLSSRGFIANDFSGQLIIINPNPNTPNNAIPLVILDDVQLTDFGFLNNFQMNTVDYIEINKAGIGYGLRGGGGVIKIVTDPIKRMQQNSTDKNDLASYTFPITFNSPKKYYAPIYENYTSKFFQEYGTISWFPNLKADEKGIVTFKMLNTFTPSINLYIEGVINGEIFISESKTIYPLN
jgi:hypothetical protein